MKFEQALVSLGRELEKNGWTDPDVQLNLFELGDDDKPTRWKAKAILFLKSIEAPLRKLLCTDEGKVRHSVRAAPDILAISVKIISDKEGVDVDPHFLADVLIQSSLEAFCSLDGN